MFIESLGDNYASDNLYGAHFIHEGKLYSLRRVDYACLLAWDVDADREVSLDSSILTGWKSFKYPRLGYRRITDKVVGLVTRAPRSYTRGLSVDNVHFTISEASRVNFSNEDDEYDWNENNHARILKAAMLPVYDGRSEWRELLQGGRTSFVPSHDLLLERGDPEDKIRVHVSRMHVGFLHNGGKIEANATNTAIINNIVRKYAA